MNKKTKLLAIFSIILPATNLMADCMGLSEGEVYRLDAPSKSLHSTRIQDQDGLGSCYANTASVLLKANLPDNPNVSYLNLALFFAQDTNRARENGAFYKKAKTPNDMDTNLLDGGFTCDTINNAKKKQIRTQENVLCKSEDVALEHAFYNNSINAYEDPGFMQGENILNASKYLTAYAQTFGADLSVNGRISKRAQADLFAKRLESFVKDNQNSTLAKYCQTPNLTKFEKVLSNGMMMALNDYPGCFLGNTINSQMAECRLFTDLGNIHFDEETKRTSFIFKDSVMNPLFQKAEMIFQKGISKDQYNKSINELLRKNITSNLPENIKDKFINKFNNNLKSEDRDFLNKEYDSAILGQTGECIKNNQLAYFYDTENFLASAKKDNFLCQYENLLSTIPSLAGSSSYNLISSTNELMNFLLLKDKDIKYDKNIENLIASDCAPSKRLKIPETLVCKDYDTDLEPKHLNDEKYMQKHISHHRQKMLKYINANQPIAIDFCTRFWNDPDFKLHSINKETKYKKCQESGKHGIHATAMIGYRCKDNKLQYLAQNSWGPNWKLDNPKFEIENGKIWLDERELFENLLNYSGISK